MRVLVACEFSGTVRDAFASWGHEVWSCDLLPTEKPGLHYQGNVLRILDGWTPVRYSMECDPEGDGWCRIADCDSSECKCYGPTQDDVEYLESEGEMFARPTAHPHWDLLIAHPPCTYLTISAEWAYKDPDFVRYPGVGYHQKVKPETLVGQPRREAREDAIRLFKHLLNAPIPKIAIENPVGVLSSRVRKPDQIIQPHQFGADASKSTCLWLKGLPTLRATEQIEPRIANGKKRWANQTDGGQNKLPPSDDRWAARSVTYPGIAEAMAEQWGLLPT